MSKGTLAFDSTNGAITFTADIKGNGSRRKNGRECADHQCQLCLADYQGVVKVSSGTLQLGSANGSKLEFTGADIVVGDATLKLNGNGNNLHSVSNNIDLLNGAEIYIGNSSGPTEGSYQYTLSGNIRIGQSATDVVDITTQYAKTIGLTGTLSGEGTLQYLSVNNGTDDLANRKLFITGENTDFTGTVNVGSPDGTGDAPVKKRALVLAHQNALVNATVNLFNEDGYLQINNADKTGNIAGLNGKGIIAGESSGVAADSPDTLNLVQKDGLNTFTGTIADTVSLVRSGAGTFIFAGTNNGRILFGRNAAARQRRRGLYRGQCQHCGRFPEHWRLRHPFPCKCLFTGLRYGSEHLHGHHGGGKRPAHLYGSWSSGSRRPFLQH